jgi:hypothetical protein
MQGTPVFSEAPVATFTVYQISLYISSKLKTSPSNSPCAHECIGVIYLVDRRMHAKTVFAFRERPLEWDILASDCNFVGQLSMIIPAGRMGPSAHTETEINNKYVDSQWAVGTCSRLTLYLGKQHSELASG